VLAHDTVYREESDAHDTHEEPLGILLRELRELRAHRDIWDSAGDSHDYY